MRLASFLVTSFVAHFRDIRIVHDSDPHPEHGTNEFLSPSNQSAVGPVQAARKDAARIIWSWKAQRVVTPHPHPQNRWFFHCTFILGWNLDFDLW